jgi:putative transposase
MWTHLLFSTKDEQPLITRAVEPVLSMHLKAQLSECRCPVKIISGVSDHVHLLLLLHPEMALTSVVKQIKGNSSHWINSHSLLPVKFAWQKGFNAFSISDKDLNSVIRHINHQATYHQSTSYLQELDELIATNGLVRCPES